MASMRAACNPGASTPGEFNRATNDCDLQWSRQGGREPDREPAGLTSLPGFSLLTSTQRHPRQHTRPRVQTQAPVPASGRRRPTPSDQPHSNSQWASAGGGRCVWKSGPANKSGRHLLGFASSRLRPAPAGRCSQPSDRPGRIGFADSRYHGWRIPGSKSDARDPDRHRWIPRHPELHAGFGPAAMIVEHRSDPEGPCRRKPGLLSDPSR